VPLVPELELKTKQFNLSDCWEGFLQDLVNRFGQATFDSWFKNINLVEETNHSICFSVRSRFIKEWISINYKDELVNSIKNYKPNLIDVDIVVRKIAPEQVESNTTSNGESKIILESNSNDNEDNFNANLDSRYTFENFIVGDENRLSYTATRSFLSSNVNVMGNLNTSYIYSNVGLGKSHLLSALAHELEKTKQNFLFLTSERFTYNYSRYIRNSDLLGFKGRFQGLDFLLLDDVHFLQGKKSTQQEVLNIIEYMVSRNKKILMVGDRKLGSLDNFNQKITSLMSAGIVTTISNPGKSLKEKIIKQKCDLNSYNLTYEIIDFLSQQNFSSIREIEGAINKLMIYQNIFAKEINIENIIPIIDDFIIKQKSQALNPEMVIKNIAKYFRISVSDLKSKSRKKELVLARNIAIFLIKENSSLSLSEIGKFFSNRDHATVLYSYNKIKDIQLLDLTLKYEIEKISDYIKNI